MKVGIHQPNYLPWLGFFYKMSLCDIFVLYDDVQYSKNSYINRVQIKTPNGVMWLTIPVRIKGKFGQQINEVETVEWNIWVKKHIKTWESFYKKTPYFNKYFDEFADIYKLEPASLSEVNIRFIYYVSKLLDFDVKIVRSSELNAKGNSTNRLIGICKELDADTYISGKGGSNYQDEGDFIQNKINIMYSDFLHPKYDQSWGDFVPGLSIMDLFFNHGDDAKQILTLACEKRL